jgi:hypothetical protein
MKLQYRRAIALLHLTAALAAGIAMNSIAAFFAVWLVNPLLTQQLGVAYNKINVTTYANMVAQNAKAAEELWVKRILMGAEQANVFSDEMIGGPGSGKPFIQYDELTKVDGNTINVPTIAPLGGPGAQGEGDRSGNEEKLRIGGFPCKIGRQWYGIGITDVSQEETVIGSQFDNLSNKLLRTRLGRKISEDLMMTLRTAAIAGGVNMVRPNFKASRELLKTADVFNTPTITKGGLVLSGLGGKPVGTIKNDAGGFVEQFLFFGTQFGLAPLGSETAYLQALQYAENRGKGNPIFRGDFVDWNGHGIYRWYLRDHEAYGPVGSVIQPRAFLGTAIPADNTAYDILGGGDATGSTLVPAPNYFEAFSNAPWVYTNGNAIAADVTTVRYVLIYNLTGANAGKMGFYSYQVNTGNKRRYSTGSRCGIWCGADCGRQRDMERGSVAGRGSNRFAPVGSLSSRQTVTECRSVSLSAWAKWLVSAVTEVSRGATRELRAPRNIATTEWIMVSVWKLSLAARRPSERMGSIPTSSWSNMLTLWTGFRP